ncbi:MAG: VCBS repeat-containing protein [Geopsychrobacter sp.]|nr:VCBS repeat-containing protein [Geopsychrobacter sp.]
MIPALACAAEPVVNAELVHFFRPLQAQVIMPVEEGILIDKGGADQIAPGDIFATVVSEKQLTHPQTGKILDVVRTYGALFEVTRIKQNLAYCKPLDSLKQPLAGAKVRRFENLPIYFESSSSHGFQLFRSLRENLPQLKWQNYQPESQPSPTQEPALIARYTDGRLQILDYKQKILFESTIALTNTAPTTSHIPLPATIREPSQKPVTSVVTAKKLLRIKLPPNKQIKTLRFYDLDGDGSAEAILGFENEIQSGQIIGGEFSTQSTTKIAGGQEILQISILDLDQDKRPEIAVSTLAEIETGTTIYRYINKKLTRVTSTRMLLGSFVNTDGSEILLGIDKSSLLNTHPKFYRITLAGDTLQKSTITIPKARQVSGMTTIAGPQGESLLVQLVQSNKLKVTNAAGETLWLSGENYGGSLDYLSVPQPGSRNIGDDDKLFLMPTLEKTADKTLLVAKHDGARFFKNSPNLKNGRLVELQWNGFTLEQIGISQNLGGQVADFDQVDLNSNGKQDLVVAVVYKTQGFFSKPISGLIIIPNNKP